MGVYLHGYMKLKIPMLLDLKNVDLKKSELTNDIITILENLERVHHCWIIDFLATETVDVNACLN